MRPRLPQRSPASLITQGPGPSSFPASWTLSARFLRRSSKEGEGLWTVMCPSGCQTLTSGEPHSSPTHTACPPDVPGSPHFLGATHQSGLKPGSAGWGVTKSSPTPRSLHLECPVSSGPGAFGRGPSGAEEPSFLATERAKARRAGRPRGPLSGLSPLTPARPPPTPGAHRNVGGTRDRRPASCPPVVCG